MYMLIGFPIFLTSFDYKLMRESILLKMNINLKYVENVYIYVRKSLFFKNIRQVSFPFRYKDKYRDSVTEIQLR